LPAPTTVILGRAIRSSPCWPSELVSRSGSWSCSHADCRPSPRF